MFLRSHRLKPPEDANDGKQPKLQQKPRGRKKKKERMNNDTTLVKWSEGKPNQWGGSSERIYEKRFFFLEQVFSLGFSILPLCLGLEHGVIKVGCRILFTCAPVPPPPPLRTSFFLLHAFRLFSGSGYVADIAGGLKRATELSWRSPVRLCILFADAPCHGSIYHDFHDAYPKGCPEGVDPARMICNLQVSSVQTRGSIPAKRPNKHRTSVNTFCTPERLTHRGQIYVFVLPYNNRQEGFERCIFDSD